MTEENLKVTLSEFTTKYLKEDKGTADYIESMIECCLNLLGEDGDFPETVPSYELVGYEKDGIILTPRTIKSLFDKTRPPPNRRHELYGLLSLLQTKTLKRFVRYLEEDLLERAFNGPSGQG